MSQTESRDEPLLKNEFAQHNHISSGAMQQDYGEAHLDVTPQCTNPYGYVHGGALFALADNCAGMVAHGDGRDYVTLSTTMNYLKNTRSGRLTAEGTVVSRSRRVCLVRVQVKDEGGVLLADGSFTMYCVSAKEKEGD